MSYISTIDIKYTRIKCYLRKQTLLILLSLMTVIITQQTWAITDPLNDPSPESNRAFKGLLLDIELVGDRFFAVGERGHIIFSDDHGSHWKQAKVPTRVTLTAITFASSTHGWAVGHDGVVLATTDGGLNWVKQLDGYEINKLITLEVESAISNYVETKQESTNTLTLDSLKYLLEDAHRFSEEGASRPLLDVAFLNEKTGFISGAYGLLLRTDDGGNNWKSLSTHTNNSENFHYNSLIIHKNEIYAAGEAGTLYESSDEANTWTSLASPYDGPFFGINAFETHNITTLVTYGLRGHAFLSTDKGVTWKKLSTNTDAALLGMIKLRTDSFALLSTTGEILLFDDLGNKIGDNVNLTGSSLLDGITEDNGQLSLVGANGLLQININSISGSK